MRRVVLILLVLSTTTSATLNKILIDTVANSEVELTPKCNQQFEEYFKNLSFSETSWAMQMLDATSKLPSGLFSFNIAEMGDFQQCVNIEATGTTEETILGKYCLGYISISNTTTRTAVPDTSFASFADLGGIAASAGAQGPVWALCLPDGCTPQDANTIGNSLFTSIIGPEVRIDFPEVLCQTTNEVNPELTAGAITTICILALLMFILLTTTLYDIYCTFFKHQSCHLVVKAFSVYSNGKKIFKMAETNPDQLPCLNGLKFISMMWVVAGHQFSVTALGPVTNTKYLMDWANSPYSMFLISGTLSVDTFFTVGGTLMAYGYMKAKYKKIRFNLPMYYIHRYLRLTPPFALVVLVSATLLQYLGSGPKWPYLKLYFQQFCVDYWWSALLYVQNYVNVDHMCVGQTWYLSIDMQLYLISPLVFYVLWKWPKACLSVLGLSTVGFMGASFYISWINKLGAILSNFYTDSNEYNNKYYLLTHTRATPWVIGIMLGYYIFKIKQGETRVRLNKLVVFIAWGICLAVLFACVLGGHSTLRGKEYDRWGNSFHITFVRPVWSLAIAWVILACTTNYGGPINWVLSLPIYQVLNRFTYSIYLTHVTMLYTIIYGKKWPQYFSNFDMAYQFWGTLWFSTGLSALLVFATESPMIIIEKMLFGSIGKQKKQVSDPEKGIDNLAFEK